jgi:hypothetical protein
MAPVPPLSDDQRRAAAAKATAARRTRAELKQRIHDGQLSVSDAFEKAGHDEAIAKLKVLDLLQAFPGIGVVRARETMGRLGIAESRRIRGLGPHQREALIAEFEDNA